MSWSQMAAHSMAFFAGGYESTSSTTAFAIYELAQNHLILQKTREEIFAVLDRHEGEITYDILMEMKYLSLVIEGNSVTQNYNYSINENIIYFGDLTTQKSHNVYTWNYNL